MGIPGPAQQEVEKCATRLVLDARRDPASKVGAIQWIADQLGIHPEALRTRVRNAVVDGGTAPGVTLTAAELDRELK